MGKEIIESGHKYTKISVETYSIVESIEEAVEEIVTLLTTKYGKKPTMEV